MRIFVCPYCKTELKEVNGSFKCPKCNKAFPVVEGIPDFLPKEASRERNRLLNATKSITPEASPMEKLTTLSLTFLIMRTIIPPIPVAIPAIRLRRIGSITEPMLLTLPTLDALY